MPTKKYLLDEDYSPDTPRKGGIESAKISEYDVPSKQDRKKEDIILLSPEEIEKITAPQEDLPDYPNNTQKIVKLHLATAKRVGDVMEYNKATLKKNSVLSLNKVLVALFKYPDMILQIRSYADSRVSKDYNKKLSLKRANVTKQWLVNKGVNSNRLLIQAIGEENKDNICKGDANCSEAEYQLNRKSTFKILKF